MGRSPRVIWLGLGSPRGLHEKSRRRRRDKTESPEAGRGGHQPRDMGGIQHPEKAGEETPHCSFQKEHSAASPLGTSDLQNATTVTLCLKVGICYSSRNR